MMIYFNKLLESEQIKIQKTKDTFGKEFELVQHICNFLIALPFSTGKLCDDSDINNIKIQDPFLLFIYDVPFKIRSIYKLLEIANYADAAIILRTLAEATIVYKFYISKNDGEGLSRYILRKTKRSIKDIMNDILPGYYDNVYASLCNFTHGDAIAQAIFRNILNKEPLKTHIAGINSKWFYYVSNQTISIVPCIIDMYDMVFPNNIISGNCELSKEKEYIFDIINKFINTMTNEYTAKTTFYHYYQELLKK